VAEIYHLKEEERLALTMSPNEAERLLAMASSLRNHVMLSLGYGCGLRAGEFVRLKAGSISELTRYTRQRPWSATFCVADRGWLEVRL